MKESDILAIINDINKTQYIPDILANERNENIPPYDFNTSCVAHKDQSPSMRVYLEPGRGCYCFSCGKSYTPYSVMKHITGLSAKEIIDKFINEYNYKIPDNLSPDQDETIDHKLLSTQIRQLRKHINPKALSLLNKSITVDFKNGNNTYTTKFYQAMIDKFEHNII